MARIFRQPRSKDRRMAGEETEAKLAGDPFPSSLVYFRSRRHAAASRFAR